MIFNIGDMVRWEGQSQLGIGVVIGLVGDHGLRVRFEDFEGYFDTDEETGEEDLDYHYVSVKNARHLEYKYNPDQAGDTEDDI